MANDLVRKGHGDLSTSPRSRSGRNEARRGTLFGHGPGSDRAHRPPNDGGRADAGDLSGSVNDGLTSQEEPAGPQGPGTLPAVLHDASPAGATLRPPVHGQVRAMDLDPKEAASPSTGGSRHPLQTRSRCLANGETRLEMERSSLRQELQETVHGLNLQVRFACTREKLVFKETAQRSFTMP